MCLTYLGLHENFPSRTAHVIRGKKSLCRRVDNLARTTSVREPSGSDPNSVSRRVPRRPGGFDTRSVSIPDHRPDRSVAPPESSSTSGVPAVDVLKGKQFLLIKSFLEDSAPDEAGDAFPKLVPENPHPSRMRLSKPVSTRGRKVIKTCREVSGVRNPTRRARSLFDSDYKTISGEAMKTARFISLNGHAHMTVDPEFGPARRKPPLL